MDHTNPLPVKRGILSMSHSVKKKENRPETNSLPLKIGHPKRTLLFQPSI